MDVDRIPELIEAADPPDRGNETEDDAGWADLADRYNQLTGSEFIRLPDDQRAAAVRARHRERAKVCSGTAGCLAPAGNEHHAHYCPKYVMP